MKKVNILIGITIIIFVALGWTIFLNKDIFYIPQGGVKH